MKGSCGWTGFMPPRTRNSGATGILGNSRQMGQRSPWTAQTVHTGRIDCVPRKVYPRIGSTPGVCWRTRSIAGGLPADGEGQEESPSLRPGAGRPEGYGNRRAVGEDIDLGGEVDRCECGEGPHLGGANAVVGCRTSFRSRPATWRQGTCRGRPPARTPARCRSRASRSPPRGRSPRRCSFPDRAAPIRGRGAYGR